MTTQVNTWAPTLRDSEGPTERVRVPCGPSPPENKEEYWDWLCDRMQVLIDSNPKEARRNLEELPVAEGAQFSSVRTDPIHQWAFQIPTPWHTEIRDGENAYRMKSTGIVNNTKRLTLGGEGSSKVKTTLAVLAVDE